LVSALALLFAGCRADSKSLEGNPDGAFSETSDEGVPDGARGADTWGADVVPDATQKPMPDAVDHTYVSDASLDNAQTADATSTSDTPCSGWTTLVRLSPIALHDLLAASNPIVINVHIPYAGDIPGTEVDIPFDQVDDIETYLKHDHCADVVLVCNGGSMSLSAGNELIQRGYLRVRDLNGGMGAWQAAGYPLQYDGGVL
jgi:rhodanese-related sulfurtransferase